MLRISESCARGRTASFDEEFFRVADGIYDDGGGGGSRCPSCTVPHPDTIFYQRNPHPSSSRVVAAGASRSPQWVGPVPDSKINASAGLPVVANVQHFTVYNATDQRSGARNAFGTYNHGPLVTVFNDTCPVFVFLLSVLLLSLASLLRYLMSWYNAPKDETTYKRSVFSHSTDGKTWSSPAVLFPNYTKDGQENGPWTTLNGRLYTQCGTQDAGLHIETIISVMRRVHVPADGSPITLGPVFWLNRPHPPPGPCALAPCPHATNPSPWHEIILLLLLESATFLPVGLALCHVSFWPRIVRTGPILPTFCAGIPTGLPLRPSLPLGSPRT